MTDFRKLAADARAQHDAEVAAKEAAFEAAKLARHTQVEGTKQTLEASLLPLLIKAKEDLARENVQLNIERQYDVENFLSEVQPTIKLTCKGPKRRDDGWQWETPALIMEPKNDKLSLFSYDSSYTRSGRGTLVLTSELNAPEELVAKAIEHLVAAYFAELKKQY